MSSTTPAAAAAAAKLAEARRTTNLRVLQRFDPQIVDLAITASHVVLYQFSLPQQQWIKKNIEGTLFVCKRSDVPRFKLIVSNRNSTENLEVGITSTFQMQVREPYLIFRDNNTTKTTTGAGGEVENEAIHPRGLWFHDDKERQQVHSFLENVVKSLQTIEEMEKEHGPPPSLVSSNDNDDNAVSGAKKPPPPPPPVVEVNTNAAGAALLSTLTLNDNNTNNNNTAAAAGKSRKSSNTTTPTTTTPQSNSQNININNNALDKKSLQLALLSLIREERFLDLIHAQYLKVVSSRAQREQQQQQQQHHQQEE